jgi:hypothetical protein
MKIRINNKRNYESLAGLCIENVYFPPEYAYSASKKSREDVMSCHFMRNSSQQQGAAARFKERKGKARGNAEDITGEQKSRRSGKCIALALAQTRV